VAIALLAERGLPAWWAPMLKFCFTLAYVLLAPYVGAWADAVPKARCMGRANAVKALAVAALLVLAHPLLVLAVVGVGAAAYAPAKYGLVTELVPPPQLVAANGWIEVSTVLAVVLGTALGGGLVSPAFAQVVGAHGWAVPGLSAGMTAAVTALLLVYGVSALLTLGVPDSGARYAARPHRPALAWRDFAAAQRRLWADADGALSMAVTTLFWGAAAVLQFAVLRWGVDVLGLGLDRAAYLQAAVAVGIVAGAAIAGRWVALSQARRVLPLGVVLGLAVPLAAQCNDWAQALPAMAAVGALGGAMLVPMNALLQHRGHVLLSAGRSVAVQGFNENASVLAMLALYAALLAAGLEIRLLMALLGAAVAAGVLLLALAFGRRPVPQA